MTGRSKETMNHWRFIMNLNYLKQDLDIKLSPNVLIGTNFMCDFSRKHWSTEWFWYTSDAVVMATRQQSNIPVWFGSSSLSGLATSSWGKYWFHLEPDEVSLLLYPIIEALPGSSGNVWILYSSGASEQFQSSLYSGHATKYPRVKLNVVRNLIVEPYKKLLSAGP